jgi:hypothetical protein
MKNTTATVIALETSNGTKFAKARHADGFIDLIELDEYAAKITKVGSEMIVTGFTNEAERDAYAKELKAKRPLQ